MAKSEMEKIIELKLIGCAYCDRADFNPWTLECECEIKGKVEAMSVCEQFIREAEQDK